MASERIDYEMVLTKHHCVKEIQDLHLKHYLQYCITIIEVWKIPRHIELSLDLCS